MDTQLRMCIEVLRVLADQPANELNRVPLAERRIDEYLRAKDGSPERLRAAINAEGEDPFWVMMREYVQSRMRRSDE
jgi:hypothetical protein